MYGGKHPVYERLSCGISRVTGMGLCYKIHRKPVSKPGWFETGLGESGLWSAFPSKFKAAFQN
jgi:hypothetical protein